MEADGGMPPFKDPPIKLFGTEIALPDSQIPSSNPEPKTNSCNKDEKASMEIESPTSEGNSKEPDQSSTCQDTAEKSNGNGRIKEGGQAGSKDDQMDSSSDQEKAMKKPDKVIPCPRCNSLETKFCYFNNYNVNQPRHFCKNCQRYWTAGGTMRNVPVGAGRRKNKHLVSQYRQIMVPHDGVPVARVETHDQQQQQPPDPAPASSMPSPTGNGMVLKFGPDQAPLCESMQNVNLGDQRGGDVTSSGSPPPSMDETSENVGHRKDQVESSAPSNDQSSTAHHHPLQCFPVAPLIVPWSWNGVASTDPSQVQWCPTPPMLAVPGFSPPGVPLHFLPASYLSCMPMWPNNGCHSPSSSTTSCSSGNGTPTLGKHCRDTSFGDEEKVEKSIVIPKTLRIDDPNEALRSPLWSALGLKPEPGVLVSKGSIFKSFGSKGEGKAHVQESAHILEANPAALSRSQTFQEGS